MPFISDLLSFGGFLPTPIIGQIGLYDWSRQKVRVPPVSFFDNTFLVSFTHPPFLSRTLLLVFPFSSFPLSDRHPMPFPLPLTPGPFHLLGFVFLAFPTNWPFPSSDGSVFPPTFSNAAPISLWPLPPPLHFFTVRRGFSSFIPDYRRQD